MTRRVLATRPYGPSDAVADARAQLHRMDLPPEARVAAARTVLAGFQLREDADRIAFLQDAVAEAEQAYARARQTVC